MAWWRSCQGLVTKTTGNHGKWRCNGYGMETGMARISQGMAWTVLHTGAGTPHRLLHGDGDETMAEFIKEFGAIQALNEETVKIEVEAEITENSE